MHDAVAKPMRPGKRKPVNNTQLNSGPAVYKPKRKRLNPSVSSTPVQTKRRRLKSSESVVPMPSSKGGIGLFATKRIPAYTVLCVLRQGMRIYIDKCFSCELMNGGENFEVMSEVLACITSLVKLGTCTELQKAIAYTRAQNPRCLADIQCDWVSEIVKRICCTFCCDTCDAKYSRNACYELRNAWTIINDQQHIEHVSMDCFIGFDAERKEVEWGLDPDHHSEDIRAINEPNSLDEANSLFVDHYASRQTKMGGCRQNLLVVSTRDIEEGEEICASYGPRVCRDYKACEHTLHSMMIDNKLLIEVASGKYEIHTVNNGPCVNLETELRAERRLQKVGRGLNLTEQLIHK